MMSNYTPKNLPIQNLKWEAFVHLIGKANAEVGRFDALLQNILNPSVLLSPLTTFLQAVIEQSKENIIKAKKIISLYEQKKQRIAELTKSQFSIKILDALFVMPIFKSNDFIRISKISQASAFRYIGILEENGVILSDKKRKNKLYFFNKLLDIVK